MDPIAESQSLYHWQPIDHPAELAADPSFRQLQEARLQEGASFQIQSGETQRFLVDEAVRIGAVLTAPMGAIRFQLPQTVLRYGERRAEKYALEIPDTFRQQIVAGFLNRLPVKDSRSAFRIRLSRLENSGYTAVRVGAGLLRFAVVRHIVHDLVSEDRVPASPAQPESSLPAADAAVDGEAALRKGAQEDVFVKNNEAAILRLRSGMSLLQLAVSLAPYMYADEEYQHKWNILLSRLVAQGHVLALHHVRTIVSKIRRRAGANALNRGLWVSLPYFNDRTLEMDLYEFEVIPPGRMLFVPAFVTLAAVREQEKIEQQDSLNPSTRIHLLAELKSLEQAFDNRPE
jgi:hypothetical protein